MKICFLFNHDAAHQVAHSIGVAVRLAEQYREVETVIAFGSDDIRREIEKHLSEDQIGLLSWHDLSLSGLLNGLLYPLNRLFPARRLGRLIFGGRDLRAFDMIVSTERTCLMLKRKWGINGPKFIFIPHGAGDRSVTYHRALQDFDLMLVSGQKVQDQMVAHNLVEPDQCRIIGYPKFDGLIGREPQKLFDNDNPVFLYNPHFDPHLSSWYDEGQAILDWFYQRPHEYNLILAPHVMLFFKELHISPEYKTSRRRPDVGQQYYDAPNILVDLDSERLFDMSYTLAADAYIGDVSSQIYEFLHKPRPAFFVDTHSDQSEPPYEFWRTGPVAKSAVELLSLLPLWEQIGTEFQVAQQTMMDYTINIDPEHSAAERGAVALVDYGQSISPKS